MAESLAAGTQQAHSRATIVRYLLIAFILVKLIALGSSWAQHAMLIDVQRGAELTHERASANDARQQAIGVIGLLLFLGTVVCWLMWQHRAYSNLRLIGSRDTEFTPGWSVGYWFIPLINLFRPYQVTAEIYRRSEIQNGPDPIGGLSGPPLVGAWWFAYLVWGGSGRFAASLAKDAETLPALISAGNFETANQLLGIVATVLALMVIGAIDRLQLSFPVTDNVPAL